jgi:hypothetical protein
MKVYIIVAITIIGIGVAGCSLLSPSSEIPEAQKKAIQEYSQKQEAVSVAKKQLAEEDCHKEASKTPLKHPADIIPIHKKCMEAKGYKD